MQVALTALDGARLAAWRIPRDGARATVVCVPGYAASRSALLARARAWHDLGAEVVLLDPRGVGEAEGRRTSLGLDEALDVAAAAAWARDARRAGDPGRPVVVDGVSQGGAAALRAARDGGPGARAIDGLLLEAVFDRLTTTVGHRFAAMGLPREPGTTALLAWGSLLLGRDAFAHDPVAYAASVRVPAAVVSGEDDPWVRPDEARALHAGLGGPRHLALAPGVGHASVLDRSPETWRAAARWLLDAVDRSGAR